MAGSSDGNWGRWGPDDEIGLLNLVTPEGTREALAKVRTGEMVSLGLPIGLPGMPDPVWPGRVPAQRTTVKDWSHYAFGKAATPPGGVQFTADTLQMSLHGSTHLDALGHAWYDDSLYNAVPASNTVGELSRNSIYPVAQKGIVLSAALVDLPSFYHVECLEPGHRIDIGDVERCLRAEDVDLETPAALIVRTGWLERYYQVGPEMLTGAYHEPGLTADSDTLSFFREHDIALLGTDTLGNERTWSLDGEFQPLHKILIRDLGVLFLEAMKLDELSRVCADRRRYEFCLIASPLKCYGATGSPVNPLAIL